MTTPLNPPDHSVLGAIALLREAWRNNDGAEGDSVKLVCSELTRLRAEQAGREAAVGELLAVLCGDGGHYVARYGIEKAALHALAKVQEMRTKLAGVEEEWAPLTKPDAALAVDEGKSYLFAIEVRAGGAHYWEYFSDSVVWDAETDPEWGNGDHGWDLHDNEIWFRAPPKPPQPPGA